MVIGEVIRQLREEKNLTREDLACQLNTSISTIKRIETGKVNITSYTRMLLEGFFNININEYQHILKIYNNYTTYVIYNNLKESIYQKNLKQISKYSKEMKTKGDKSKGEPFFLYQFSLMIISYENKKYKKAVKIGFDTLNKIEFGTETIDNSNHLTELIKSTRLSPTLYSIINLLAISQDKIDTENRCCNLMEELFTHFKERIFNEEILVDKFKYEYRDKFIMIILNYASSLYDIGEYNNSIEISSLGIEKCIEYNNYRLLERLYSSRVKSYRKLNDYKKADSDIEKCIFICKMKGNESFLKQLIDE